MDNKFEGASLVDVLAAGEMPLMEVLVNAGISCKSCYRNPKRKSWGDGGLLCNGKFVSAPELNVCLEWKENRTLEEIAKGPDLYKEDEQW